MTGTVTAFVAVLCIALLTAGSAAIRSASRIWLRHRVEREMAGWGLLDDYLERPQRLLGAAASGVSVAAFVLGASLAGDGATPLARIFRVLAWAMVVVVFGELIPRAVARRWPAVLVPMLTPLLGVVSALARPLGAVSARATRRFRSPVQPSDPAADAREDLQDLLREGAMEGVGEASEIAIISGVVTFADKTVSQVMTPRDEVFAVDAALPPLDMARRMAQAAYSRVPVYRHGLDDIVGMVLAFDVFRERGETVPEIRPVAETDPATPCNELLFSMLRHRLHFAIVKDASGHTVGIVTLEDMLEELVGDIRDEHDEPPTRAGAPAA